MRIFYFPCHCTMEYDEVKMFHDLGHEVFSTGVYQNPNKVNERLNCVNKSYSHHRPEIQGLLGNEKLINEFNALNRNIEVYSRPRLSKEFLSNFDLIYITYDITLLNNVLNFNLNIPVIYNTLGQIHPGFESYLRQPNVRSKIKIVRFSEAESSISNFAGVDYVIHPGADSDKFNNWNGNKDRCLAISRAMPIRPQHTNLHVLNAINLHIKNIDLYGTGNESLSINKGAPPFSELVKLYQDYRLFINLNTKPGSFTYTFVEAMMTGCPIVSVGPQLGSDSSYNYNTFIGHTYIENGVNGFWSDNIADIIEYCNLLIGDKSLADYISKNARETGLKYFDSRFAHDKWGKLLNEILWSI